MTENINETATDELDVEGHKWTKFPLEPEQGSDEDVEGHVQPPRDLDIER